MNTEGEKTQHWLQSLFCLQDIWMMALRNINCIDLLAQKIYFALFFFIFLHDPIFTNYFIVTEDLKQVLWLLSHLLFFFFFFPPHSFAALWWCCSRTLPWPIGQQHRSDAQHLLTTPWRKKGRSTGLPWYALMLLYRCSLNPWYAVCCQRLHIPKHVVEHQLPRCF